MTILKGEAYQMDSSPKNVNLSWGNG